MVAVLKIRVKKERINGENEAVLEHGVSREKNDFSPSKQPSVLLHLWSVLPVLLIAEGDVGLASIALLAALINFFLIQAKTKTVIRYMSSGVVSAIPFLLYFLVN
jgi:cell division protein FtsW (lipid II flippase)